MKKDKVLNLAVDEEAKSDSTIIALAQRLEIEIAILLGCKPPEICNKLEKISELAEKLIALPLEEILERKMRKYNENRS